MGKLSEVVNEIREVENCSNFIKNILNTKDGNFNQIPTQLFLKLKEIKKEFDEKSVVLRAREIDLVKEEIGEDAVSWLNHNGFSFDREIHEYNEVTWTWYTSDYIIRRIFFRRGSWGVKYPDIVLKFRDLILVDKPDEINGSHPAAVVASVLEMYKNGLNKMSDLIKEAMDRIEIFNDNTP